jgi:hypothetical protein
MTSHDHGDGHDTDTDTERDTSAREDCYHCNDGTLERVWSNGQSYPEPKKEWYSCDNCGQELTKIICHERRETSNI